MEVKGEKLTYVLFALLAVPLVAQAATTDAEELGRCIYNNTSSADRDTLVQFMYVLLGSTNAARKVQSIPQTKINQVNSKTKTLASNWCSVLVASRLLVFCCLIRETVCSRLFPTRLSDWWQKESPRVHRDGCQVWGAARKTQVKCETQSSLEAR